MVRLSINWQYMRSIFVRHLYNATNLQLQIPVDLFELLALLIKLLVVTLPFSFPLAFFSFSAKGPHLIAGFQKFCALEKVNRLEIWVKKPLVFVILLPATIARRILK